MRIVAGTHRGRPLRTPAGRDVRPTLDRVRESIFAILGDSVRGARVLDLFAGSGALGIEALSRGASEALFIDSDPRALRAVRDNLTALALTERARARRARLPAFLSNPPAELLRGGDSKSPLSITPPFDIILADPPYRSPLASETVACLITPPWFASWRCVVIETERRVDLTGEAPPDVVADRRVYGDTAVLFLTRTEP